MSTFKISKSLNNNVLIANDENDKEVVLIGRGIGFGKKPGEILQKDQIEKLFVLKDPEEQRQYKEVLVSIDEQTLKTIIKAVEHIRTRVNQPLNEHIHIGLTDHLAFAITRMKNGIGISNPFLLETKGLYPKEFEIATEITELVNEELAIDLPLGEIGFIALHIHSAIVDKEVGDMTKNADLMMKLIQMIESELRILIDKSSLDYMRLIRHLQFAIERVLRNETVDEPEKITELLKLEYPICYNLAWKLIKVMQQELKQHVYEAEAVYLTLHLQRIQSKYK